MLIHKRKRNSIPFAERNETKVENGVRVIRWLFILIDTVVYKQTEFKDRMHPFFVKNEEDFSFFFFFECEEDEIKIRRWQILATHLIDEYLIIVVNYLSRVAIIFQVSSGTFYSNLTTTEKKNIHYSQMWTTLDFAKCSISSRIICIFIVLIIKCTYSLEIPFEGNA